MQNINKYHSVSFFDSTKIYKITLLLVNILLELLTVIRKKAQFGRAFLSIRYIGIIIFLCFLAIKFVFYRFYL